MREFIEYLVTQIVHNPDQVVVNERQAENETVYELTVAQEDMGLIIGKEGRTIKSIRALAKSKAIKDQVRVNVELLDPYKQQEQPQEQEPAQE